MARDWTRRPFSDFIVTEDFSCPDSHPELVFYRPWYGADLGCECLGIEQTDTSYDLQGGGNRISQGRQCTYNQTLAGCKTGEPHTAVIMGQLADKRFCGKPVDFNFLNATRSDLNGDCPSSYVKCAENSSPDNTICVPDGDGRSLEEKCPIL